MTQQGKRRFKPLSRPSAFRDAQLIIIATEDTKAEPKYFRDVASYYKNPKVHVEVLTRPGTASSPEYVINMLDKFKQKYHLNKKKNKRTRLELELIRVFGEFNKKNLKTRQFIPFVKDAIIRAMKLDVQPEQRWPLQLGTRIYLLVEKII